MKFNILTNTEVTEFKADGGKLSSVIARDRGTGETVELSPAAAFVYIGLSPNSDFLKDTVELDRWGFVKTEAASRDGEQQWELCRYKTPSALFRRGFVPVVSQNPIALVA